MRPPISPSLFITISALSFLLAACSTEDGGGTPSAPELEVSADRGLISNPDRDAYFGDLHIHTRNSVDAYMFGARVTPEDAYRFARGEAISHPGGYDIQLAGLPLDFLAVTDHAEYLGIMPAMADPASYLSEHPIAVAMFTAENRAEILAAFKILSASMISGVPIEDINDQELINSVWADTVAAADAYYEPGILTTFAGFEYSVGVDMDRDLDTPDIATLHRNVIFKGTAPDQVFSALDSIDSEDLWDWMDGLRGEGIEALAIPHNSNISSGLAFDLKRFSGSVMDAAYAEQRTRNEPLVEITQVKGTSETHPLLSPNDEWANFELYEVLIPSHVRGEVQGSYVREALQNGLRLQEEQGFNPFHFGFAGASDTHVGGGSFDEQDYWSKLGRNDAHAHQRGSVPPDGAKSWEGVELDPRAQNWFAKWSASGLTGVWAEANTREAIYAALRRKETFATSGTRIRVRFFAGLDFEDDLIESPNLISKAYNEGVPMGSDLTNDARSPAFIAWAMRDPRAAPLQRLQIVKGWTEAGETHEKLYDIACSDGLEPDPDTHRCPENGARVDLSDCSISDDAGASELKTIWRDPDFDPAQHAFYYVRVLENPTCRWSTWDAVTAGTPPNQAMPATLQERAWSSPIWLSPAVR